MSKVINCIDIYSKYQVKESINACYKSYDSDADDFFKKDTWGNEYEICGGKLIDMLIKRISDIHFSDITIKPIENELSIIINTFDPLNGDGDEYVYIIKRMISQEEVLV